MCELDWEILKDILIAIISVGVPSVVAVCIFRQWKNQKGTEVIAHEIKITVKNLLEIINISYNMSSYTATPEMIENKYRRFEELSDQILRMGLYVDESIEVDNLKTLIDNFNKTCWEVKDSASEINFKENHEKFKSELKTKVGYIGSQGMKLVNTLIPYSTFQKKFIFKKK